MTARIGERVARLRAERKMTVQALADRCAELGVPLGRVTLTKLEGGKRQAITPAELTVLAAALGAAPIELLYPIGYGDDVEILPGRFLDPLAAVQWFCGELNLELTSVGALTQPASTASEQSGVYLLQMHRDFVDKFQDAEAAAAAAFARAAGSGADERDRERAAYHHAATEEMRGLAQMALRPVRSEMRRRGMMLPVLTPSLKLDDEEAADEH
jgi:transcriptional regulator with XRE-family HTH domain